MIGESMNLYRGNLYRGSSIQKDVTPHSLSLSNCVATIMRTWPHTPRIKPAAPFACTSGGYHRQHCPYKTLCDLLRGGKDEQTRPEHEEFLSRSNCRPENSAAGQACPGGFCDTSDRAWVMGHIMSRSDSTMQVPP